MGATRPGSAPLTAQAVAALLTAAVESLDGDELAALRSALEGEGGGGEGGGGGGSGAAVLRFAGTATTVGSDPETHFFACDSLEGAGRAASYGAPIPLPGGARTAEGLRIRVLTNTLSATVMFRVYIDGAPTTIAVGAIAGLTGLLTDTLHVAAVDDGQTVEIVAELSGGTAPGELVRFTAALALS